MKIILIIPSLNHGGAERVMSLLANQWAILDHEIHLVILVKSQHFYTISEKIHVHELNFTNTGKTGKIINGIKTFIKLRRLFLNINADFALSFIIKYNILSLIASLFTRQKLFVSDRNNPKLPLPGWLKILKKTTYKQAAGIIAQTSLAKKILEQETGNHNIQVIANPIKKIHLSEDMAKEKIILNIGSLHPQKGQKYLLEAFAKIQTSDWKLVILGEGQLREQLKQLAIKLGIQDNVEMPGAVADVDFWLAKAAIFAFPSMYEGFPNALAEAMSAGLPCVSFNCDTGPSDMIVDGINGFLIPTGDSEALSERIKHLMDDQDLRNTISTEAIKITAQLDIKPIAEKYLEFCQTTE